MVMGVVLVGGQLLVGLVWSNIYGSCAGGGVAIRWTVVIKYLWELCCWECSYWWGWCDQMFMGAVSVGV